MAGFYDGSDLADKTFYGFRLHEGDGNLNVEIINDGVTPVSLPQVDIVDANDYKQWFWTRDTVRFKWSDSGHLHMVIL